MTDGLKIETTGGITTIALNDPKTLNALTPQLAKSLAATLMEVEKTSRVIILTGSDRAFCSGANLQGQTDSQPGDIDAGSSLDLAYNPLMLTIRNLEVPLITAISGPAAGIGASIAMAGDIIIAGKSSYFLEAFCHIGLVPDGGATWMLVRNVGRVRAAELALLGEKLSAQQAHEWGMVTRVVEDDAVMPTAQQFAERLANGPTHALGLMRKLLWIAGDTSFDDQLSEERDAQASAGKHPHFAEGVAAFLEKRKSKFE
ncbi:enoyl-CoA hydratase-related protein [Roseobacter sp. GAI101]|uniref:enoyl-CoA hydratase-related protein n=1 Tax=Roseobacter sp. (strain GAI101) TaxID=391589 RepID=UPI0001871FEF|nr:enoyl-CoA hydratase-related protein [Roseobacter sp. GAI101]EEB84419.1 enoyl-CoA hydratase [Roseobacter sp. GAI101]